MHGGVVKKNINHCEAHPYVLFVHAMHGGGGVQKHSLYSTSLRVIIWWCSTTSQLNQMNNY
jgi:hypothetical protein